MFYPRSSDTAREEAAHEAKLLSVRLKESYSMMATKLEESQGIARKEVAKLASEHNSTLRKYETLKLENENVTGKLRFVGWEFYSKIRGTLLLYLYVQQNYTKSNFCDVSSKSFRSLQVGGVTHSDCRAEGQ